MSGTLEDQIMERIGELSSEEQQRVLDFARGIEKSRPVGVSGRTLLRFGGTFDAEDARAMSKAIEDGCERIDPDEW